MEDARPLSLRSFDEEVEAREEIARAKEMVRATLAERDRIREEARREGLEQARAEVAASERERVASELAEARELLKRAAEDLRARGAGLVASAERDLVKLALAIAAKIVKKEVVFSDGTTAANVRRAIELTADRKAIRILLHPQDLSKIEAFLPDLRLEFADLHDVAIEASDSVDRGGCVVSTREGSVDARIATQLEEIERGLLG